MNRPRESAALIVEEVKNYFSKFRKKSPLTFHSHFQPRPSRDHENKPIVSASENGDDSERHSSEEESGITTRSGLKVTSAAKSSLPPGSIYMSKETDIERRRRLNREYVNRKRMKERANETEKQRAERVKYWKKYRKQRRLTETPEARRKRLDKKLQQEKKRIRNLTEEKKQKRAEYVAKWRKEHPGYPRVRTNKKRKSTGRDTNSEEETEESSSSSSESESNIPSHASPRRRRVRKEVNYVDLDTEDEVD